MAVDVAASRPRFTAPELGLARLAAIPARYVLVGIVAVSFATRWLAALAHATPLSLPDESIYSSLARSLATSGRPLVRGGPAHFPALLEPLLAAPLALVSDPGLAYRLTQGEHALAMSLAAVPVYLLSRRLGLGAGFALAAGAIAVASPDLLYSSYLLAEPVAYPLVLGALAAGVSALARPTRRAQLAFVALSALAAFARVQFLVLPVAFVVAALVVERGAVRSVVRNLRLSLGVFAVPVLALAVLGPARLLGYYSGAVHQRLHPGALVHWAGVDAMLLAYSAGWVLVPGALVGLALALARPRERAESAFAALTAALACGLLAEAALYASNGSARFQERYLFTLLPLAAPAFGLYLRRGLPRRAAVAALALGLLVLSARIPLAGYAEGHGKQDSPFLLAFYRFERLIGTGSGGLALALAAGALSLVAVGVSFRPRRGPALALGLTLALLVAASVGAFSHDRRTARTARVAFLPADLRWVDHARLGAVSVLMTPGAPRESALETMFWNRSLTRVLLLRGASPVDVFANPRVRVAPDGTLLLGGRALRGPLLVSNYAVAAAFSGAKRVASGATFDLWRPAGTPRLSLLAGGRYFDGWLAHSGWIMVWPDASASLRGTLHLRLFQPREALPVTLRLSAPGLDEQVTLAPGQSRLVTVQVFTHGLWTVHFRSSRSFFLPDGRVVSVQADRPTFTPGEPQGPAASRPRPRAAV